MKSVYSYQLQSYYHDSGLRTGTIYFYNVLASNGGGESELSIMDSEEIEDEVKKALGVQTEGRWIGDGKRLGDLLFENRKPQKRIQRSNTTLARWGQLAGLDKD